MRRYKVRTLITLLRTEEGGLKHELPSPTQSLVVHVRRREGTKIRSRLFETAITTDDDEPLIPGDKDRLVTILVTDDKASEYLQPGQRFDLWPEHDLGAGFGKNVGTGIVSRRVFV
ncbi:hypothetical protein [Microtetraspora fusca]|uniref:Uncharacterized protein n=1 Tax=Microtetraspora fusca TaxID=1997 RepID=A0ABW6VFZ6_MICFU|nr:hypothetical protein [Microtetraspora fusca]